MYVQGLKSVLVCCGLFAGLNQHIISPRQRRRKELNLLKQTDGVELIMCSSVKLACGVVTCSFSCLARFKRPTDGRVTDKTLLALAELTGPELVLVSLFSLPLLPPALLLLPAPSLYSS